MRILVLGDSYCPAAALAPAFDRLEGHEVSLADLSDAPEWQPRSASETRVREYLGSPAQVIAALDGHDVLVVQGAPVTDEVMAATPQLKLICVTRGGPVNVDLEAATRRGIPVIVTPGKNATAVAELTLALMIMLARRVAAASAHVNAGHEVYRDNYEGASWYGHELAGKTLGLVGFGHIGRLVAERARAFGMAVLVHDPYVSADGITAAGARVVPLERLLAASDHVSLHARATPETRGLFERERIGRMKRGAFLINTARDTLIDEDALAEALRQGRLGGAALDVASPSDAGSPHALLGLPNVILLPHIGGATLETLANGGAMSVAEIERFAAGEPLVNLANWEVLASEPAS